MATASKIVASCQGWPPWATATLPESFTFCMAATSSSQVVGTAMPSSSRIALFAQTQLVECTFTGAAIHSPSRLGEGLQRLGHHRVPALLGGHGR